jgi:hypothetical protein
MMWDAVARRYLTLLRGLVAVAGAVGALGHRAAAPPNGFVA